MRGALGAVVLVAGCGRIGFTVESDVDAGGDASVPRVPYRDVIVSDNPVGYWRLDDLGTVAVDQMGLNNGAYAGTYARVPMGATSDNNGAVRFNDTATTTHMRVPDAPALRLPGSKSLEVWYNPNGNIGQGTWPNVISKGTGSAGYLLYYFPSFDSLHYRENGGTEISLNNLGINPTGWNHIVFTYDATTNKNVFYVNGVGFPVGVATWPLNTDTSALGVGTIRSSSEGSTGWVDEVAVYNYPLSAERVLAHYDAAK